MKTACGRRREWRQPGVWLVAAEGSIKCGVAKFALRFLPIPVMCTCETSRPVLNMSWSLGRSLVRACQPTIIMCSLHVFIVIVRR